MNDLEYKFIKKKLRLYLIELYIILCSYGIGFLLFICSSEYIILKSINIHGIFVWNNLNLVWVFGLIIMFTGLIINLFLYWEILKFEKLVIKNYFKLIELGNKYISKWKKKVKNHLSTKLFFLNLFNIEIWLRSLKSNFEYQLSKPQKQNDKNDKLSSIIEEYYNQLKKDNK